MLQDKARSAGFVFTAMDGGYAGPLSAIHGLRGTWAPARRNAGAIAGMATDGMPEQLDQMRKARDKGS